MFNCCSRNPSPLRPSSLSFEYLLLPRSADGCSRDLRSLQRRRAFLLVETKARRLASLDNWCRPDLQRHPFSGWLIRQVSCYFLLADSTSIATVTVYINQHLLWALMGVVGHNPAFGSSHRQFCLLVAHWALAFPLLTQTHSSRSG